MGMALRGGIYSDRVGLVLRGGLVLQRPVLRRLVLRGLAGRVGCSVRRSGLGWWCLITRSMCRSRV